MATAGIKAEEGQMEDPSTVQPHSMSAHDVTGTGDAQPRSKRRAWAAHLKRFWWAYLLGLASTVVLVVCLVIFVGVPRIAQHTLNKTVLTIQGINATEARAGSINMAINSTITGTGGVSAAVDPFVGSMYLQERDPTTPFVSVKFPATRNARTQTVNISQDVALAHADAFANFNTWLFNNESVQVRVAGDTAVKVKGIAKHFGVTFDKTVKIPGLNKFSGLKELSSTFLLAPDAQGDNFIGFVDLPNRSYMTLEVGNISLHTYLLGQEVATTYMDNVVLNPGSNNVSVRANIGNLLDVLAVMDQKPYCETGQLPFELLGKSVVRNGENLTYYAAAMQSSNITILFDVGKAMKAIGLNVTCVS